MASVVADRKPPEGWSFTVKELSAGMYEVKAESPDGLVMFRSAAHDYTEVLSRLIDDAWKLSV